MKIVVPVSRTFPKRSRDRVFVAIGAFATVASHLPTTLTPHFSHYFSTNQELPNSPTIYHSRVPWTNCPEGMCQGFRGSKQGSKRRVKSEPMHRSFLFPLPPTLIDACSIDKRWTGASSHAPLAPRIIIYRSRYRQGCKNKTEGSVLSCLKRMPDDFTSIIETYIYIPLSHVAEQTTINIHFCVVSLPSTVEPRFYPFTLLSRFFLDDDNDSLTSKMRGKREGGEGGKEERGYLETLWRRGREVASDRRAICQPDSLCSDWTRVK